MKPQFWKTIGRGIKGYCPACGVGTQFKKWAVLNEQCSHCALPLRCREDDTYFFMYLSAGFITGTLLIALFFVVPTNIFVGKIVLLVVALSLYLGSWPYRKGLAVAIDYYIDSRSENPRHLGK